MKPQSEESLHIHKWTLLGGGFLAVLLHAWLEHYWLMQLPMKWQHVFQVGIDLLLLGLVAAIFHLVLRYERRLKALNARLMEHTRDLEELENTVDARLIDLAQRLSLSLAGVTSQAQLALQHTTDLSDIKVFSQLIDDTHAMKAIADELIALKQMEVPPLGQPGAVAAKPAAKEEPLCVS